MILQFDLRDNDAAVLRSIFHEKGIWNVQPGSQAEAEGTFDRLVEAGLLAAACGSVWLTDLGWMAAGQLVAEAGHKTLAGRRAR